MVWRISPSALPFRLVEFGWSLSLSCILSFSLFFFCWVFSLFIVWGFLTKAWILSDFHYKRESGRHSSFSFTHTYWANLCFWQRGLGSDIYSCRFLREWCVTEVANDAWYIFIRTSIHEESSRRCPFRHRKKKSIFLLNKVNGLLEREHFVYVFGWDE